MLFFCTFLEGKGKIVMRMDVAPSDVKSIGTFLTLKREDLGRVRLS